MRIIDAYAIPISEKPTVDATQIGSFKIVLHIPAGTYDIILSDTSKSGGYAILSCSSEKLTKVTAIKINRYVDIEND